MVDTVPSSSFVKSKRFKKSRRPTDKGSNDNYLPLQKIKQRNIGGWNRPDHEKEEEEEEEEEEKRNDTTQRSSDENSPNSIAQQARMIASFALILGLINLLGLGVSIGLSTYDYIRISDINCTCPTISNSVPLLTLYIPTTTSASSAYVSGHFCCRCTNPISRRTCICQ